MTQKDKELLLKDLCARLPYNVKIAFYYKSNAGITINEDRDLQFDDVKAIKYDTDSQDCWYEISRKPYLRPMSSMTEEEEKEYHKVLIKSQECSFMNSESATTIVNDWLLSKNFDVRGLIEKGLALESPEGMYKTE